jgi:hypothetical protein
MVVRFQFGIMLENGAYLYVVCGFEFFVDCHRFVVVVCMALVLDDDGEGWSSFGQGGGSLEEGGGGGLFTVTRGPPPLKGLGMGRTLEPGNLEGAS